MNVYPPKESIFDGMFSWDEGSELSPVMFAWSAIGVNDTNSFLFFPCKWSAIVPVNVSSSEFFMIFETK